MATDWEKPLLTDEYSDFRDILKDQISKVAQKDFDGDSNVPVGFLRLNDSTDKEERYTGSSWVATSRETEIDAHINNGSLHGGMPIGAGCLWYTGTAPDGYIIADGTPKNRASYPALFALWGTTFGAGDGSTTFGIPDKRGYISIGKAASGTASAAIGGTFGSLDHVHTGPSHTHTINSHTHDMGNHTHTGGAHTHAGPDHVHFIQAHYHDVNALGADISITSSGSHTTAIAVKNSGSAGSTTRVLAASSSGTNDTITSGASGSNHTHDHSAFAGRVGHVATGNNGDNGFNSGSASGTTGSGGAVASSVPSTNITGGTALTTNSGGSGNTGVANPPCMIVNFIIKAL